MAERSSEQNLDAWLGPFRAAMGRKTRRTWAPQYLRGLLGPGDRKSLQPMTARLGLPGHDQLQHVIASSAWDDGPLWAELGRTADRLVGGPDACLVSDDTALPKKGIRSLGVARQYRGALGKKVGCQSLVPFTLARNEVPVPVGLRLFLLLDLAHQPLYRAAWLRRSTQVDRRPARRCSSARRSGRPATARPGRRLPFPMIG